MIVDKINDLLFKKNRIKALIALFCFVSLILAAIFSDQIFYKKIVIFVFMFFLIFYIWVIVVDFIKFIFEKKVPTLTWWIYFLILTFCLYIFYYLTSLNKLLLILYSSIVLLIVAKVSYWVFDFFSKKNT